MTQYAEIKDYISEHPGDPNAKFQTRRAQLDTLGRVIESTVTDPVGGDLKTENTFGSWSQVTSTTVPHRALDPSYGVTYGYVGLNHISSVSLPSQGTISYSYHLNETTVTNIDGHNRRYIYQEDGKITQVLEQDDTGQLTVATDYAYDTLGRLITISQGAQTRSFSYDVTGRIFSL